MNFKPELMALLVILAFVFILYLVIRSARKNTAEKNHQVQSLGFVAESELPPRLASRVDDLFKRRDGQAVYIDSIFSRREMDRELFIFDIGNSSDDENDMGTDVFGMISSEFALPRFTLTTLPGFNSDSILGSLMESLLDKVLSLAGKSQDLTRIEITESREFGSQVIVFGSDQSAVQEMLRGIQLSSLLQIKSPIHIAGIGDFLTVDFSLPSSYSSEANDLITQYQQFTQLARYFMR